MKKYVVLYRIEQWMAPCDPPFGFVCQAEDTDHAEEQCLNAYSDADIVWVFGPLAGLVKEVESEREAYLTALDDYWYLSTEA